MTLAFDQSRVKRHRRAKHPARGALILFALILGTLGAYYSTAPLVVAASGIALIAIIALLWGSRFPPILLLPPLYQWTEVALTPMSTIWLSEPLQSLSMRGADLEAAAYYGLMGVVMLALGLRLAMEFGRTTPLLANLLPECQAHSFRGISRAAFILIAMGYFFEASFRFGGPAREFFNSASGLKSAGIFILAYWCLSRRQNLGVLIAVLSFEIVMGMTGFFAGFKNSILALILAAIIARPKFGKGGILPVAGAGFLLIGVAIFWSAIKIEYREFVNQGTGAQVVLVPIGDRVNFIGNAASNFTIGDAQRGFELLVVRHGYIDFLAQTMRFVPNGYPHTNGALTQAVVGHIAMPRILFSDKPALPSDTEVMARYTGQSMTWYDNTSVSVGYLAELYVDFGYLGGLFGMMVIGLIVGAIFRMLAGRRGPSDLLKAGLCVMASLPLAYFGTAYVKLIGALVFTSVIALSFQFLAPRYLPSLTALKMARERRRNGQISDIVGIVDPVEVR